MAVDFNFKDAYKIEDLIEITAVLRGENGCPWDKEQNHQSIRKNLIEETYEVIEAINKNDKELLLEELGDVLMQVVFHTQLEVENGGFDFDDVANGICQKLILRHPHVFGDISVNNSNEVLRNWDDIKVRSKGQKTQTQTMLGVPRELPALMRAGKIQQKAAKVGFDWQDVGGAMQKLCEEMDELDRAIENKDEAGAFEELGDLLFSAVNVSRFIGCDAEEALTSATDKFISRFSAVEAMAAERGIDMKSASLKELDALWEEVKSKESE